MSEAFTCFLWGAPSSFYLRRRQPYDWSLQWLSRHHRKFGTTGSVCAEKRHAFQATCTSAHTQVGRTRFYAKDQLLELVRQLKTHEADGQLGLLRLPSAITDAVKLVELTDIGLRQLRVNAYHPSPIERISNDAIAQLPLLMFSGRIVLVHCEKGVFSAVEQLRQEMDLTRCWSLGIDLEWKPESKGNYHRAALLQLATADTCVLFRVQNFGEQLPEPLRELLEDPNVVKVGMYDIQDKRKLRDFGIEVPNSVHIGKFAQRLGFPKGMGIRSLSAMVLSRRMSKLQARSDWERISLTQSQIMYATLDAW
eukprot:CAMPEP_0184675860 /NCGR_PEP_ID=MMETSP0308-20130426/88038_1 /TAXON_ID=38269 /ORGANISM="Gloeochaete witrockiana, Strain SAG 46.84" /LENGTH=308 /DNA_ID=CAMNT_0027123641 /DNA_START=808 /DNA_END=1731 /DNA_ORIENTATION=+